MTLLAYLRSLAARFLRPSQTEAEIGDFGLRRPTLEVVRKGFDFTKNTGRR